MSKLLMDEHPLQVLPKLAMKTGLNEALILQQIHYWNEINKKAKNNYKDGHYWTFNSVSGWQEQFPFWSTRTIQRIITNLEKMKLVITGNYNRMKIDRTKWYRIDYSVLSALEESPFGQIDVTNMTTWINHLAKLELPLPEINTKTNAENNGYITLTSDVHIFITIYLNLFKKHYNKDHMRVTKEQYDRIITFVHTLEEYGIEEDYYWEQAIEHFSTIPNRNNGNILAFITASHRYFEVGIE